MKLQLLQPSKPSPPNSDHHDEMNRLYERLTTNAYSDSESVRQTILGRMIFLLYQQLPK
jgi:hypothetical protein